MRADMDALIRGQSSMKAEMKELQSIIGEHVPKQFAMDRQRMTEIENTISLASSPKPQPRQENQAAILNMILANAGGMWLPIRDIRHKMNLSEEAFSRLLSVMKTSIDTKPDGTDGRRKLIRKKNKIH